MKDEYPIDADSVGMRIDQFVAGCIANFSRSRLTLAIRAGHIRCHDKTVAPAYRLREGDRVVCDMAAVEELIADSTEQWSPRKLENAEFAVLHADEHLLVIDKPPGIAVHPGAGHHSDTLANHLLHEYPELSAVARAGIVHRLDLDTSGLLVVARSEASRTALIAGFADRSISRSYRALVVGAIARESEIDEPIGRHRTRRTLMAVRADGRPAITRWKVSRRFADRAGKKVAELDVQPRNRSHAPNSGARRARRASGSRRCQLCD